MTDFVQVEVEVSEATVQKNRWQPSTFSLTIHRNLLFGTLMQYNSNESLRIFDYGAMFLLASSFRTQEASDEEERCASKFHQPNKSKTTAGRLINFRMAKTKKNRRGANYTTEELTYLAIAVNEILPQNSEDWTLVIE